jgi:glycosyltransferase involved in cell wall biosynthesis
MRILIVNFEYPPLGGGGGVATRDIAQELAKRHQVTVLTSGFSSLAAQESVEGVDIVRVPVIGRVALPTSTLLSMATFIPSALWRGFWLCRELKFDVVNAQFVIPSGVPAALLARLFRIPLVVSFIGGDVYDPSKKISPHRHWWLRVLVRWIARQADACTAISTDTKRRTQELHGVKEDIVVTHLGLTPAPKFSVKSRAELGLQEGRLYAITIGRLIPRKGYDVLFEAWRNIHAVDLLVLGDGPLKSALEMLIVEKGLRGRIRLCGFVSEEEKQQLLHVADIYVSAAEHEGFGIVFLEGMDAGLPVVAVNEGGQRDFLISEQNALLVPAHDSNALAAAVNRLANDTSLRHRLAGEGKRRVEDFYLPPTVAKFEKILLSVTQL